MAPEPVESCTCEGIPTLRDTESRSTLCQVYLLSRFSSLPTCIGCLKKEEEQLYSNYGKETEPKELG